MSVTPALNEILMYRCNMRSLHMLLCICASIPHLLHALNQGVYIACHTHKYCVSCRSWWHCQLQRMRQPTRSGRQEIWVPHSHLTVTQTTVCHLKCTSYDSHPMSAQTAAFTVTVSRLSPAECLNGPTNDQDIAWRCKVQLCRPSCNLLC